MESVLRAAALYLVLLLMFRVTGRRSLRETTPFDLVLLLVVGEATQQALLGEDFSMVNALVVIATLLAIDVGFSLLKQRSAAAERLLDGVPTILVAEGKPIEDRLARARVDLGDILQAARERQGITTLAEIRWAVLEADGMITIIPQRPEAPPAHR
ncbi:DUF421 domain-containing protein [Roseomonas stagni]|uniref:DUF421 domain-containing protein n=1 Tax=Falsiroseomonas algicola TaxID=2716930 RepID=A0A6M1LS97_9PROT|nr:YetF domain-containing protein [Falsiroseomonas algicola]NGM23348.1 DUF421 domain-containing protein [Falsiroseomonas algicola]